MKPHEKRELERLECRKSRRREIIQAAKRLFLRKGVMETSMVDIANEAEISRFTLYRYFSNKYELLIEVQLLLYEEMGLPLKMDPTEQVDTVEQLRRYLYGIASYLYGKPDLVRFSYTLNHLFSSAEISLYLQKRFRQRAMEQGAAIKRKNIAMIIEEGIKDGSFRDDIDPKETTILMIETVWGLVGKLLNSQNHPIWGHDVDHLKLLCSLVDVLVDHIKAE
ncbi:MAG: TetR/AcrR family transcriptional regulator [Clostridia bacterium]|jgi:AcrR family transcriptional regulator